MNFRSYILKGLVFCLFLAFSFKLYFIVNPISEERNGDLSSLSEPVGFLWPADNFDVVEKYCTVTN